MITRERERKCVREIRGWRDKRGGSENERERESVCRERRKVRVGEKCVKDMCRMQR